jgi:hypothetical protein
MFVLDTTGSMSACADNEILECFSNPLSKIAALRNATEDFYVTVEAARAQSARVRYGFVPYSSNINVGFLIPRRFMANEHTFQSRVARFRGVGLVPGNGVVVGGPFVYSDQLNFIPRDLANLNSADLTHYLFNNGATDPNQEDAADIARCQTNVGTFTVGAETWTVSNARYVINQWQGINRVPLATRAGCQANVRRTRTAVESDVIPDRFVDRIEFLGYRYCKVDTVDDPPCGVSNPAGSPPGWDAVELSSLYNNNPNRTIDLPTGNNGAMQTHIWGGCIEEASTVWTDNYSPIPAGAFDLDINLRPENEAQRWKPALPDALWQREDAFGRDTIDWSHTTWHRYAPRMFCPRNAARKLAVITRDDLVTYVNSLIPDGDTYHDIGMVWGARFLSPRGLFRDENSAPAPNGDEVVRHLVFMTDGRGNVARDGSHGSGPANEDALAAEVRWLWPEHMQKHFSTEEPSSAALGAVRHIHTLSPQAADVAFLMAAASAAYGLSLGLLALGLRA